MFVTSNERPCRYPSGLSDETRLRLLLEKLQNHKKAPKMVKMWPFPGWHPFTPKTICSRGKKLALLDCHNNVLQKEENRFKKYCVFRGMWLLGHYTRNFWLWLLFPYMCYNIGLCSYVVGISYYGKNEAECCYSNQELKCTRAKKFLCKSFESREIAYNLVRLHLSCFCSQPILEVDPPWGTKKHLRTKQKVFHSCQCPALCTHKISGSHIFSSESYR